MTIIERIRINIPNALTCGNIFSGCIAIVYAMNGDLLWAGCFVCIGILFDFFDGFFARLLKVNSEIGKQLDSLADLVTFGVVPGIILFKLINYGLYLEEDHGLISNGFNIRNIPNFVHQNISFVAFMVPVFSALRLAKFNIDTRQTNSFLGVPTPLNALLICSIPFIYKEISEESGFGLDLIINPLF